MTSDQDVEVVKQGGNQMFEIRNLKVHFPAQSAELFRRRIVRAVDGVSFSIGHGEVLGLVGESGSGKTTVGRAIARLTPPTEGSILLEGSDIASFRGSELKAYRRAVQMIFQDPYESLNPRLTVFSTIAFPMRIQGTARDEDEMRERCINLLTRVGLRHADIIDNYPHELSGGERQRVSIARALALHPRFIIADEPVSMLDISIRSSVLNLLTELKEQYGLTYLLIAHDLRVAYYMSDRIMVIYLGKIMETASTENFMRHQFHPYSRLLFSAFADLSSTELRWEKWGTTGEIPSAIDPPRGCRFHPRCPFRVDRCDKDPPPLSELEVGHYVACFNPQ